MTCQRSNWNPGAGEHRRRRPELLRRDAHRRPRHDAGLHPDALLAARRLHAVRQWNGTHTVKGGVVLSFLQYDVTKFLSGNPVFSFRQDESFAFPFEARYGVGNPDLSTDNRQLGFYVQDDWTVGPRLTLNAGLRWDYESDMLNNDYVTPDSVRPRPRRSSTATATSPTATTGRRSTAPGSRASACRTTLTGSGSHVLFAGYGRYFDRVIYNAGLDERFRLQYAVRSFRFSLDGAPAQRPADHRLGSRRTRASAGLDGLIASGIAPTPEVFLIDNDTRPPVSDQFNAGVRTNVRGILISVNYAGIRGRNGMTFLFGNRRPDGTCCQPIPGFSNILDLRRREEELVRRACT